VYIRSGSSWAQQDNLYPSDGTEGFFGISVAIHGDTVFVGACDEDDEKGDYSGSVHVFTRSGSSWTEEKKLTASDGAEDDYFGYRVAVDGDTVVVGSPGDDDWSGSAYVFELE